MLRCSTHRRCLRNNLCCIFNNPPSSPCLRVTLLQTLNTSGKPYHSNILKTQPFHFKTSKIYRQQIEKTLHKFKENINK